jgi:protein TonB
VLCKIKIALNLLFTQKTQTTSTMLFDLTDIIFENRNKSYGAYKLRKTYHRALGIGLLLNIPILFVVIFWIKQSEKQPAPTPKWEEREIMLQVNDVELADISDMPASVEVPTFVPPVVPEKKITEQETSVEETDTPKEINIHQEEKKEEKKDEKNNEAEKKNEEKSKNKAENAESVAYTPDVWSIYIKKNLVYPPQGIKEQKECNVFVSVIIQTDGTLQIDKERANFSCEEYFNEEIRRLVANAPRFIPFTDEEGKPIAKRLMMKIPFQLPK